MRHQFKNYILRDEEWGGIIYDTENDFMFGADRSHYDSLLGTFQKNGDGNLGDCYNQFILRYLPDFPIQNPFLYQRGVFIGNRPDCENFKLSGPISVSLSATHFCNSKCIFCCTHDIGNKKIKEIRGNHVSKMIDANASLETLRIIVGGGEPMIRKDIVEMLAEFRSKFLYPVLATNAILINDQNVSALCENVSLFQISLDTIKRDKYAYLRGDDSLPKVFKNLDRVLSRTKSVRIVTVLNRHNEDELEDVAAYVYSLGIRQWFIFVVLPSGLAARDYNAIKPSNIDNTLKRIECIRKSKKGMAIKVCGLGKAVRTAIYVDHTGDFSVFDYGLNKKFLLASLKEDIDVKNVWEDVGPAIKYDTFSNFILSSSE